MKMMEAQLQVVILGAGRGSRMTELIGNNLPKCLIPVAGNPLIFYPMKSLVLNGFAGKDVLVIVQERDDVKKMVEQVAEEAGLRIEIFAVPEDSDDFGTAQSLRLALKAKKINRDALIISCDLIGDLPLRKLVELYETKQSSITALYMKSLPAPVTSLPGPRRKAAQDRDIIGVKSSTSELVFMASEADLDEDLAIPVATLRRFPNIKITTWLTDSHVYILRKEVLQRLLEDVDDDQYVEVFGEIPKGFGFGKGNEKTETINGSFDLGIAAKAYFQVVLRRNSKGHLTRKHLSLKGEFLPWIIQTHIEDANTVKELHPFHCLLETGERECIRVNSIKNFAIASQSVEWLQKTFPKCIPRRKETKISKGCKLVNASVGNHCTIGEKCKLTNVIGMDHIKIEAGCEIENVIISSNVIIGENCVIRDCLVGAKFHAVPGAHHVNDHLTVVEEKFFEA